MAAETMGVGGSGYGGLQQSVVLLNGSQHIHEECDELEVALASLPGARSIVPVSVPSDQLLCLPDPFSPANGFS